MDQAKNEFSAFLDWRKNERETEVKYLFEKISSWRDECVCVCIVLNTSQQDSSKKATD